MKQKYARTIVLGLISIILFITVCANLNPSQPAESCFLEDIPHVYIALGDSVSSGFGLPGYKTSPEAGHVSLFFEKLKDEGFVDEYHNMAVSGFTSTTLLNMLNNMENDKVNLFRNARVVTVNIGGNNILQPFEKYLSDMQMMSDTNDILTRAERALSEPLGLIHIISWLRQLIGVVSTRNGAPFPELNVMLEEGVRVFNDEFKKIIIWLETNAPNAIIIVNTVYNPVPQNLLGVPLPISNWTNDLIGSINQTIVEESKSRGFLVTDIHLHLSNRLELTNFNLNRSVGPLSVDLVHPNAEGHSLIAQLNYSDFFQYINGKQP